MDVKDSISVTLETGYLEGVSKVFIQQDSTKEMLLTHISGEC